MKSITKQDEKINCSFNNYSSLLQEQIYVLANGP